VRYLVPKMSRLNWEYESLAEPVQGEVLDLEVGTESSAMQFWQPSARVIRESRLPVDPFGLGHGELARIVVFGRGSSARALDKLV
jgi:hypothetical protein